MDAIAAITGLLRSAGEVSKVLGPYVAALKKNLPAIVIQVHSESQSTKLFLAALQGIVQSGAFPAQRAAMIKVDHTVAVLTDGVLIFSQLEAAISSIRPYDKNTQVLGCSHPTTKLENLADDLRWTSNQPLFEAILPRLEAFIVSLSLMVDALQADTDEHAAAHVTELEKRVRAILHNNPSLSAYLASEEQRFVDETGELAAEAGPSRQPQQPFRNLQSTLRNLLSRRSNHRDTSYEVLLSTSSPFASLSLSEISSPYVVLIPVRPPDIANPEHYDFKSAISPSSSPEKERPNVPNPARTNCEFSEIPYLQPDKYVYHDCLVIKAQLQQIPRLKRFLEFPWPPPNGNASYSRVLTEMHVLRRLLRSGGLHVITQMIEMVTKIFQERNETAGQSRLCAFENDFEKWRNNPQPVYVRDHDRKAKAVDVLAREVSFFTMACLDFPDLGSVMKVKGSTNWLFTTRDIAHDDYKGFVKVIGVIKTVLDRLTSHGMLKHVNPWAILQAEQEGAGELEEEGLPQDDPPAYESGDNETESDLWEKKALKEK